MSAAMGAAPVTTPGGEIYAALERGVIDATEWGTLWENISPGFSKVAKYLIIPGGQQPTAPFELVINDRMWDKLTPTDQALIETVAKLVTYESWLKIGQEDAKALDFYREQGNEIIDLDPEVQYEAHRIGKEWAATQAQKSEWFARVLKSQQEFEKLWADADRYRNVKVKGKD
jgi:TRAP-type mannitol/chloroaromatic compound transport system substrate-binding protein